jgi:hypothetical protein
MSDAALRAVVKDFIFVHCKSTEPFSTWVRRFRAALAQADPNCHECPLLRYFEKIAARVAFGND